MSLRIPAAADAVIVGSGPVGAAYARRLAELAPGARIVILERGPRISTPAGANIRNDPPAERAVAAEAAQQDYPARRTAWVTANGNPLVEARPGTELIAFSVTDADPQRDLPAAVISTNVGGMGSHWTCAVPRPSGSERLGILSEDVLDRAYILAESYLGARTDGFGASAVAQHVTAVLNETFAAAASDAPVQAMPLACTPPAAGERLPRWSGSDVVLDSDAVRASVQLVERAVVTGIDLAEDGCTAVGVHGIDAVDGSEFKLAAAVVVIAADALRSPQLLWASGIRPAGLGRYLNDQPQIISAVALEWYTAPESDTNGTPSEDGRDDLAGVTWLPFDEGAGRPYHGQVMQLEASPIDFGNGSVATVPIVGVGLFCQKTGSADDRVYFGDELDAYGLPIPKISYRLSDADEAAIRGAIATAERAAAALGRFVPGGEPRLLPSGSSIHYQGTTRMGSSADDSTCDTDSRVWGTTNVFVGGNGVIPSAIACNPTLTSVALAVVASEAAAAILRDTHRSRSTIA